MPSNMTFKTNLIPNTDLDFGLGSSDKRWKINGSDDPVLTDENVAQNNSIEAKDFRVLLSGSNNDTDATEGTNKSTNLRFNPSTKVFSVGGDISATGDLTITGNANLNSETYAESVTAGSLLVNGATNFVNIPTAPTPEATSNDTSVATTAFVMNAFTANDAMVFKGVINANSGLPADHKQGWTYRIGTAGTYANKVCEIGDIIICVTEGTTANNDHWAVIQNNIDGAVYKGTNAFTDAHIIIADSTAGKVKDSGKTITTTAPSSSAADTTIPTSKAVWSAISGGNARDSTKLPLAGGTMTGAIKRYYDAASTDPVLSITSNDKDITLFNIGHGTAAGTPSSCWYRLVYKGTGTSPNNTLQLIAAKSTTESTAVEINEDGMITFNGTGIFKKTTDAAGTANNSPALIIGGTATQAHIEIDANEIMAKTNGTTTATLYLNNDGGEVQIGGKVAARVTSAPTSGQVMIADGTGGLIKSSGYTIAKSVPSNAVFTDTDTKQNITLATTSKAFITGVTTTPTSSAQALTGVADTGVYLTATAGEVSAVRHSFNSSGTEKAYIIYNTTTNALDFVFT